MYKKGGIAVVVLVTGASRGIGKAIAQSLAKNENKVIANYNKSEEEAKLLEKEFENIEIYKADVSRREEVHAERLSRTSDPCTSRHCDMCAEWQ